MTRGRPSVTLFVQFLTNRHCFRDMLSEMVEIPMPADTISNLCRSPPPAPPPAEEEAPPAEEAPPTDEEAPPAEEAAPPTEEESARREAAALRVQALQRGRAGRLQAAAMRGEEGTALVDGGSPQKSSELASTKVIPHLLPVYSGV